jgi:GNAT superfamily N-acetyltransferase
VSNTRPIQPGEVPEVKRLRLLEEYHGRGIGHTLLIRLFDSAVAQAYYHVRQQISLEQKRTRAFYRRVGFYEIPNYAQKSGENSMEIELHGTNPPANRPVDKEKT